MFKSLHRQKMGAPMILIILVLVGLVGCSQLPTVNEDQDQPTLLKRGQNVCKILGDSTYVETVISAEAGGTVSLMDVELYFPPKALTQDTLISINIPDLAIFANQFGTDGLIFNLPVRVVMSYRDADLSGVNESSIKMAWYNNASDSWDIIDCKLDTVNKTVTAHVNHFSAYGLISD